MSTIPNSPPAIQRLFTSRDNNANSATYVGQEQRLWYDPTTNAIYVSDGQTPGGILVGGGASGNGTPGGPTNSVQLNAGNGSFTGSSNLIFNGNTLSVIGNVSGTYFIGNGAFLTGISGGNANYSNSNVASYLQVLTSNVSTTGNISGSYILGNGAFLTGISGGGGNYSNSNVASYLQVLTSNISTTGNVNASYYIGNGSQLSGIVATNIGTLGNLSVTGNANVGNLNAIGKVTADLIVSGYFIGNGQGLSGVTAQTGNLTYANTTILPLTTLSNIRLQTYDTANSITNNWTFNSTGNLSAPGTISATGNITGNYINGNGVNLTGLANITFGSTPPANAIIGDTWIDNSTGIQYVYFNDITGNIWAEMEAQTAYASVGYANLTTNTINTQVLYNASNTIVGSNNLTFDGTTLSAQGVTVGGSLQVSANSIISNTANGNLIINTTGTNAYINLLGGFGVNSYGGNRLIQTLNDTINFYTPILNSTDSCIDIIGSLDGNTLSPQTTGVMLHISGQPTLPSRIYNDAANTYAAYIGRAYNGNVNAPTQILANTVVSRIGANPYGNAGFSQLSTTRIDMVTTENQTTTNQGSQINFWATPTGSNTIVQTATLNSTALSVSGNIIDNIGPTRNFPINLQSTDYTLAITDAGKFISSNSNIIVGNSIFSAGNVVTLYNNSTGNILVIQNTGTLVYLAGTNATGNRSMAQHGYATLLCVSANTFVISGFGIT